MNTGPSLICFSVEIIVHLGFIFYHFPVPNPGGLKLLLLESVRFYPNVSEYFFGFASV